MMIGGCPVFDSPTAKPPDPCQADPNLLGCGGGTSTTTGILDNAALVLGSTLHDVLDISQVMLASMAKTNDYLDEIRNVPNYQSPHPYDPNHDPNTTDMGPTVYTEACDNNAEYTISLLLFLEQGYDLGGTTASINFGGYTSRDTIDYSTDPPTTIFGIADPNLYCRIGNLRVSGILDITRINLSAPSVDGSWTLDAEIWPTLFIHHDSATADVIAAMTSITNPIAISASYLPTTGLTITGTVMHNPHVLDEPKPGGNIDGTVFSHFEPGVSPNVASTSSILRTDSIINVSMNNIDPSAATQLDVSVDGGIESDRTGSDIDMLVQTVDDNAISMPLNWQSNIVDAPEIQPPASGAVTVTDIDTNNSVTGTLTSNAGDMELLLTDNSVTPPQSSLYPSHWHVLMQLH